MYYFKRYVIDSQIYVALMATFLALSFWLKDYENISYHRLFLIFLLYWNGYLYTKYQSKKRIMIKVLMLNLFSFLMMIILINQNLILWFKVFIIGLLGVFYNSSFLKYRIRKIQLLKVFYVGLVWAVIDSWFMFNYICWDIFFICFLYISALVLPFDIRDMEVDKIITFPKKIGINQTKSLAFLLIVFSVFLSFVYEDHFFFEAFLLSGIIASFFIFYSNQNRFYLYYAFGVETCCSLPFLFLALENNFK